MVHNATLYNYDDFIKWCIILHYTIMMILSNDDNATLYNYDDNATLYTYDDFIK